jgi:hypothetical protein
MDRFVFKWIDGSNYPKKETYNPYPYVVSMSGKKVYVNLFIMLKLVDGQCVHWHRRFNLTLMLLTSIGIKIRHRPSLPYMMT